MTLDALKKARIITALVTPFHEDGSINFEAIPPLVEDLLAHHTEGLVLAGTTGESPTLTHEEELEIFKVVQDTVQGRVPLIAGIGTNDTRDSIEFIKRVDEFGGFACGLAVTPYYNKPTQEGMYQHYKAIADASNLPVMIYNVPGRTMTGLTVETMIKLSQHPNIVAVKDCTGPASIAYLVENTPDDFLVYTGEDGEAFHAYALGADGVISVASHTHGDTIHEIFEALDAGKVKEAARLQRAYLPVVDALFSTTSPAPLKAVLNHRGYEVGPLRLPLVACSPEEAADIIAIVEGH